MKTTVISRCTSLLLAFSMVLGIIPAYPAAAAAEEEVILRPVDIDFDIDVQPDYLPSTGETPGIDAFPNYYPTVDKDGYAIDFTNTSAKGAQMKIYAAASSNAGYLDVLMAGVGHKLTLNVKAPAAGTYNVFLKKLGTDAGGNDAGTVTINGENAGTYSASETAATEKLANSVTFTDEEEVTVVFTSTAGSANARFYGIAFVPVGSVNAQFYDPDTTWYKKSPLTEGYALSYAKHGCELGAYSLPDIASQFYHTGTHLYMRGKTESYINFNVWVPEDGKYGVYFKSGSQATSGGTWKISVGGKEAGIFSFEDDAKNVNKLMNNSVELKAGENAVTMDFVKFGSEWATNTNNYPANITLVPCSDKDWSISANLDGVFKYTGDTAVLSIAGATEDGTTFKTDELNITCVSENTDVVTIAEDGKTVTAVSAGSAKIKVTATNPLYSKTAETTLDITVAERPTVPEIVDVKLNDGWFAYGTTVSNGTAVPTIAEHNYELVKSGISSNLLGNTSWLRFQTNRLYIRSALGEKVTLRTYVPVSGKYSVILTSDYRAELGGVMAVKVGGTKAGEYSFIWGENGETTGESVRLSTPVELTAGYQDIEFECTGLGDNVNRTNLYPAGITLVPDGSIDWSVTAALKNSIKYVGDTVSVTKGAVWSDGYLVDKNDVTYSYSVYPENALTISGDSITANITGDITLTVKATNTAGQTREKDILINAQPRPSVQKRVDIEFNKDEYGFENNTSAIGQATIDNNGYEVDSINNTCTRYEYKTGHLAARPWGPPEKDGEVAAFRVYVPVAGLYRFDFKSYKRTSSGADVDIYVDSSYVGEYSFNSSPKSEANGQTMRMNTIMLDAGYHTVKFICTNYNTGGNCYLNAIAFVPQEKVPVLDSVDVYVQKATLFPGEKTQVTASAMLDSATAYYFEDKDSAENTLTFSVDDNTVVQLSESGELTALKTGTAKVTATAVVDGVTKSEYAEITVTDAVLETVTAVLSNNAPFPGETSQITLTAKMSDAQTLDLSYPTITLTPINDKITIDENNLITAVEDGDTGFVINAEFFGTVIEPVTVYFTVQKKILQLEHVELSLEKSEIKLGETTQVTAKGIQYNGDEAATEDISIFYDTQDSNIAVVDENGVLTGIGAGTTDVVVHIKKGADIKSAIASVTVTDSLAPAEAYIEKPEKLSVGTSVTLQATAVLDTGLKVTVPAANVTYSLVSCDMDGGVTVTEDGLVSGVIDGAKALISAEVTMGGVTLPCPAIEVAVSEKDISETFIIDFSKGALVEGLTPRTADIETYGWEINTEKTSKFTMGLAEDRFKFVNKGGMNTYVQVNDTPLDSDLAIDIKIPESGTYSFDLVSANTNGGTLAAIYIDDEYIGKHDFDDLHQGTTQFNCIYIEAGIHTVTMRSVTGSKSTPGYHYFVPSSFVFRRISEEHSFESLSANITRSQLSVGETAQIEVSAKMRDGKSFVFDPSTLWESKSDISITCDKEDVLSIDETGKVTALKEGIVEITVKATVNGEEKNVEIPVTVDEGVLSSLTAELEGTLRAGTSTQLLLTAKNDLGRVLGNDALVITADPVDDTIVSVNGTAVSALRSGSTVVNITAELNGEAASCALNVTVLDSHLGRLELTAPTRTMKTASEGIQLGAVGYDAAGNTLNLAGAEITYTSLNPDVITVSDTGLVLPVAEGTGVITAAADFGGISCQAQITITVRNGKIGANIYTPEKVAAARENIELYNWARSERDTAVANADKYLDKIDYIWESITTQELPRSNAIGIRSDPEKYICKYCEKSVYTESDSGTNNWLVDPINSPWKIQCPECRRKFPTNDFGGFYKLGLAKTQEVAEEYDVTVGQWSYELALLNNNRLVAEGKPGYLVNLLYPEKGEGWGVDDGYGYRTGKVFSDGYEEAHTYIAYYNNNGIFSNLVKGSVSALRDAYLYTGDVKYSRAGAIILDRFADVYPEMDQTPYYMEFIEASPSRRTGKIKGSIPEPTFIRDFVKAYDAFFDTFDDPQVISYLNNRAKEYGLTNDKSTSEKIRQNCEDGILRSVYTACRTGQISANFGLAVSALAMSAVVLDNEPETQQWLDWMFIPEEMWATGDVKGGNIMPQLVDIVDRDGIGDEGSLSYCTGWARDLQPAIEMLSIYSDDEKYNLYKNAKYQKLLYGAYEMTLTRRSTPHIGDGGRTASAWLNLYIEPVLDCFKHTGSVKMAQTIYGMKKGDVSDLRYDIFTKNPEAVADEIEAIIKEHGEMDLDKSESFNGFGFSILRDGGYYKSVSNTDINDTQQDFWISWCRGYAHRHPDMLNLGMEAFGLNMAPDLGYTKLSTGDEYSYWGHSTISHNTVVVNEQSQNASTEAGTLLHFDDSGAVKLMDVQAENAYAAADIYRRSLIMVEIDDTVSYGVDFFRVKGGHDHLYSFHSQSDEVTVEGVELVAQPFGTYAGPDVEWATPGSTTGYSWFAHVRRAKKPQTGEFSVDFKITDFRNTLGHGKETDMHLKMTMLNDYDLDEVTVAEGYPSKFAGNPEMLEYVFARRQGENLDTLFTTVFEPYKGQSNIKSMHQVEAVRVGGAQPGNTDVVKAIKVVLTSDRVDYIVYSTNNRVEYRIDDTFNFCGFAGVYTLKDNEVTRVYAHDATKIGDLEGSSEITGTVKDFTRDLSLENYITVTPSQPMDLNAVVGKYIFIENDGMSNATYEILGAKQSGADVVLDIGDVTTVRRYRDEYNQDAGYVYDFAEGDSYEIISNLLYDSTPVIEQILDANAAAGSKYTTTVTAVSPAGKSLTYSAASLPRGASVDAQTGVVTWVPDGNQVGDHHFAITASDGILENTVHFVVTVYKSAGAAGAESGSGTGTDTGAGSGTGSDGGAGGGGASGGGGGGASSGDTTDTGNTGDDSDVGDGVLDVPSEKFIDLGNHNWAKEAIYYLVDLGVVNGTSANTYSPAQNIKRADFAIMLTRAFKTESAEGENFADVDASKYYAEELRLAKIAGIVNGVGNNNFNPEGEITRQDMMLMLYRALKAQGYELSEPDHSVLADFADASQVSDYAKDAVSVLVKDGIIAGSNGRINPLAKATRAEIAVMLARVIKE